VLFVQRKSFGTHSDTIRSERGVLVIPMPGKKSRNAVPVCVLLTTSETAFRLVPSQKGTTITAGV
jgi:hypothetical protein